MTISFRGSDLERGITSILPQMTGCDLIAGNGVVETLSWSAEAVGSGEVGDRAGMGFPGIPMPEVADDSQVILVSDDQNTIDKCLFELEKQVRILPRRNTAEAALEQSRCLVFDDMETCFAFSNKYAPEHLIIASEK